MRHKKAAFRPGQFKGGMGGRKRKITGRALRGRANLPGEKKGHVRLAQSCSGAQKDLPVTVNAGKKSM